MVEAPFLPYARQCIDDADVEAVASALRDPLLTTGPKVTAFEAALRGATGASHAVACNNGTSALYMASAALGIGPGDVVIVPTLTFLATASAPHLRGAAVIFSDVDPNTGLMRPSDLESAISEAARRHPDKRIRAAFVVHLNGVPADMPTLAGIAASQEITLIEDACHALGGMLRTASDPNPAQSPNGPRDSLTGACDWSAMSCFSFHPVKAIAMGEGGAVTTNDPELDRKLRLVRNHGMERDPEHWAPESEGFDSNGDANPWYYEMQAPSHNFRIPDILCALGLSQLDKLPAWSEARRSMFQMYRDRLGELHPAVQPPAVVDYGNPARHLAPARIDFDALGISRASVMRRLADTHRIGTQVHYIPVHTQPYWRNNFQQAALPGADAYYRRTLSLPFYIGLNEADIDRVVVGLADTLGGR